MRFVLFIFLWLGAVGASAQSAANYFHNAAGLYINGEMETAEQAAEAGLAIDPDDVKLQALLERIREEQEEQMRQNQQSDEGDEGEQSDEQQSEGESDRQESDQQNDGPGNQNLPQDDQSSESDRPDEAQQEPEQQADQQNQDGHEDEQQEPSQPRSGEDEITPEDAQPVQPGRMSRAEAERILGALRADESALLRSIQRRPANPRRVERDW